jgi:hypothetical protein
MVLYTFGVRSYSLLNRALRPPLADLHPATILNPVGILFAPAKPLYCSFLAQATERWPYRKGSAFWSAAARTPTGGLFPALLCRALAPGMVPGLRVHSELPKESSSRLWCRHLACYTPVVRRCLCRLEARTTRIPKFFTRSQGMGSVTDVSWPSRTSMTFQDL